MSRLPSLLFIMTDQQRFDALGAHGTSPMHTPHLDALAASGADLQRYFVNAPVCVPSRCTIFTGRYPHAHRNRENSALLDPGREMHLFRVLKQAGYRLGYAGKNHLLEECETGNFDLFADDVNTPTNRALVEEYRRYPERHGRSRVWKAGLVHDEDPTQTDSWQTAQRAIEFLEAAPADEPFAMTVSFHDPHVPHLALREVFERYPLEEIDVPDVDVEHLAAKARTWLMKYHAFDAASATLEDKRRYIAVYRAMVTWVDAQVGRLLACLDRLGRRDDTLVVFTSDHGDFNFEHGLAKKHHVLVDSLLHVPCLFSFPGHIPAARPDTFVESVDLLPTILDLLGVPAPIGVQGLSCADVLRGRSDTHRDAAFAATCPPFFRSRYAGFDAFAADHGGRGNTPFNVPSEFTKSIRERDFRYTWYASGEEELYDHRQDPGETRNVAADPAYAAEKLRFKLRLLEWNALTEDPLDAGLVRRLQRHYDRWILSDAPPRLWWHMDYPIPEGGELPSGMTVPRG